MKSAMPYLGVTVPQTRRIARASVRAFQNANEVRALARELWDEATHREERYAGMMILAVPMLRGDASNVPLIEHMVRTGAWWDFTDDLAHRLSELHERHPVETAEVVRRWSRDEDFWIRRAAILSQLGRKHRTDLGLLAEVIEPNIHDKEFFIRKAIGWALREVAYVSPEWVVGFVDGNPLSAMSTREALKHVRRRADA